MADTYTQLYFHIVFAVKYRRNHIHSSWQVELYKYITGIVTAQGQKMMIINGVEDHVHLLIGTKPTCTLSDLVRLIKSNSSKWINEKGFINGKFEWQGGFGAFTVSQRGVKNVIRYIENQEEHHRQKKFLEEYVSFLEEYEIDYNPDYIFTED